MRCLWWTVLMVAAASGFPSPAYNKLRGIYSWKALEFDFPSESAKLAAIESGDYIPGASLPIDVDVYSEAEASKVFVTIPRFQNGVPVTLGYVVDRASTNPNPLISAYPNWEYNSGTSCDSIISVYRVQVDECGRLWVLDTGKRGDRWICQPQLHVFDLRTNELITRYKFPRDQYKEDSLFVTVVVDIRDAGENCKDTFAYIADVTGFALIVYDYVNDRSWRIVNNLFYPYPPYGTFHIKGDTFDLMDGIIALALGGVHNGDRILYFHSLASRVESFVPTSVIRNYTLFRDNAEAAGRTFVPFATERTSQSAAQAMDRNGVLFFGLLSDLAIGCWNSKKYSDYGGTNNDVLIINPDTLQFPSGLKIVTSSKGRQELWVMTVSFQKYMTGSLNSNETNFRIQAGFVNDLVRGSKCEPVNGGTVRFPSSK
ncbi:yellow-e3 [Nomia melanderi]|uniref:yellow-e3 n=1 Tax=Nomia melanderi TaxID=2448451 RepID=UPI003FCCAFB5